MCIRDSSAATAHPLPAAVAAAVVAAAAAAMAVCVLLAPPPARNPFVPPFSPRISPTPWWCDTISPVAAAAGGVAAARSMHHFLLFLVVRRRRRRLRCWCLQLLLLSPPLLLQYHLLPPLFLASSSICNGYCILSHIACKTSLSSSCRAFISSRFSKSNWPQISSTAHSSRSYGVELASLSWAPALSTTCR